MALIDVVEAEETGPESRPANAAGLGASPTSADLPARGGPVFHLKGAGISYLFRVTRYGHLEHVWFGASVDLGDRPDESVETLAVKQPADGDGVKYHRDDPGYNLDRLPREYAGLGKGDYRLPGVETTMPDGSFVTDFRYAGHTLHDGVVPPQDGLPSALAADRPCQTLQVDLADAEVALTLYYTIFSDADTVTRRAVLTNHSATPLRLRRLMSQLVDLPDRGFDLVTFDGAWIAEAHKHVRPLAPGIYVNSSTTGFSSNRHNPGVLLARRGVGEDHGEVYGFNLIYSGNHYTAVELSQRDLVRVSSGINPLGFEWTLEPGGRFETPEAVLSWSDKGFNGLSANLHAFVGRHIVRGEWMDAERPVLVNNWEGTYFDFSHRRLVEMARSGKKLGAELFVLDDGWFGRREDDHAGLGDYWVNRRKLPHGLDGLAREITGLGLGFGIWLEPEMVNRDSDLYREHPDWAIAVPGRTPSEGRFQLVLDLTRPEVRDYIVSQVGALLDQVPISFVKWDCNRNISDQFSAVTPAGELPHRYILGLYEVLRRIFDPRPGVLLESCASGGNRFDLGMMCFSPQVWASDCTDPVERLQIQLGLSYLYPQSTIGAHVTASPSAQTLRHTPLFTRFNVAALGLLGYELDTTDLTRSQRRQIREQIAFYKQHRRLLQYGRLRRHDPVRDNQVTVSVHEPGGEPRIVGHYQVGSRAASAPEPLPIPGLDPHRRYRVRALSQQVPLKSLGSLVNHVLPVRLSGHGLPLTVLDWFRSVPDREQEYLGTGSALAWTQLVPLFDGQDTTARLVGDWGSALYLVEAL
ncbi:MAG: alpha-galactosidase [Propionicimonas sp.]|uniref:alpha-galactosidase n=1 Tax=Propionicimonas sp. TaxID=1955623 RepID=UPI002B217DA5|nr:alpha-galactosidase [Propionicimonas sp.]MEA4944558.1 alpha-galactosidase [Propionicimonas sp.]